MSTSGDENEETLFKRIEKKFREISDLTELKLFALFNLFFNAKSFDAHDELFSPVYTEKNFRILEFTWLYAATSEFSDLLDSLEQRLKRIENKLKINK